MVQRSKHSSAAPTPQLSRKTSKPSNRDLEAPPHSIPTHPIPAHLYSILINTPALLHINRLHLVTQEKHADRQSPILVYRYCASELAAPTDHNVALNPERINFQRFIVMSTVPSEVSTGHISTLEHLERLML